MDFTTSANRTIFEKFLKPGFAFQMKGETPFPSDKLHTFIIINRAPDTMKVLLLINGTSRVEKRWDNLKAIGAHTEETAIIFEPGSYPFFPKRTLVDCNSVHEINIDQISFNQERFRFLGTELSSSDLDRIVAAVKNSSRVSNRIKDAL